MVVSFSNKDQVVCSMHQSDAGKDYLLVPQGAVTGVAQAVDAFDSEAFPT